MELTGTLIKKNNNVILEARTVKEHLKYIREDNNRAFQIYGTVSGIEVTLLDCVASVQYIFDDSVAYGNISADPTEIIIGRSSLEDIEVKKISVSIETLNYMFSERLFNENVRFSKENPSILEFAYPKEIEAYDSDGRLCLYRTFQHGWLWGKIEYNFLPNICTTIYGGNTALAFLNIAVLHGALSPTVVDGSDNVGNEFRLHSSTAE